MLQSTDAYLQLVSHAHNIFSNTYVAQINGTSLKYLFKYLFNANYIIIWNQTEQGKSYFQISLPIKCK